MKKEHIIKECKRGNPQAQRFLLEQHSEWLYSVALRYAVDRAEAHDILQEGWIKIFNHIATYKEEGKLEGWMKRIVINVALRKMQGFEKRSAVYVETFYDPPAEDPKVLADMKYDDLLKLVNQLPALSREVFKMAVIDGMKHNEIGEMIGIEASTSRAHLSRARKKLQELILQQEQAEYHGK